MDGCIGEVGEPAVALCEWQIQGASPFVTGLMGKLTLVMRSWRIECPGNWMNMSSGKEITIHDDKGICSHAGY